MQDDDAGWHVARAEACRPLAQLPRQACERTAVAANRARLGTDDFTTFSRVAGVGGPWHADRCSCWIHRAERGSHDANERHSPCH